MGLVRRADCRHATARHANQIGGRQLQYEMFYSAAQPVVNRRMYRSYDWTSAKGIVDRLLSEY